MGGRHPKGGLGGCHGGEVEGRSGARRLEKPEWEVDGEERVCQMRLKM